MLRVKAKDLPKKLRDRIKAADGAVVKPAKPKPAKDVPYPMFEAYCERWGLPVPKREHYFAKPRKWRFDFAFLDAKVALEIDGGVWMVGGGRHNRGTGFIADQEKKNEAQIMGWKVIGCVPADLESGKAFEWLRRAMQ